MNEDFSIGLHRIEQLALGSAADAIPQDIWRAAQCAHAAPVQVQRDQGDTLSLLGRGRSQVYMWDAGWRVQTRVKVSNQMTRPTGLTHRGDASAGTSPWFCYELSPETTAVGWTHELGCRRM